MTKALHLRILETTLNVKWLTIFGVVIPGTLVNVSNRVTDAAKVKLGYC